MKRGDVFSTLPDIVSALGGSAVVVVKQKDDRIVVYDDPKDPSKLHELRHLCQNFSGAIFLYGDLAVPVNFRPEIHQRKN